LRPQLATAAAALVVIALFFALRGPHHLADAWHAFKRTQPIRDADPSRFSSLSSDGRYQMWRASVQALTHHPLTGLGGGTWEFWWARHRVVGVPYVRNAHSLIFETLAETGIPGGALIVAFLGAIVFGAVRRARRIGAHARAPFAAAAAACAGATVSLATDWSWQIAVVPVCMLALAGLALGVDDGAARRSPAPISTAARPVAGIAARLGIVAVAAACAVSVVIPLAMTSEIRQSQAAAARGALSIALQDARSATSLEPYAATAWLQQALVLEADGDLADADTAALRAQHNEPTNWTVPLILARIEAERGAIKAALASARRALKLNPSIRGYFS
jgi:O-antigen ligase